VDNPYGLKINFCSDGNGFVTAQTIYSKNFQGYPGIVHGGIITATLDEAAGRAAIMTKRPDIVLVTGKIEVRFRKPTRVNELISIEGKFISRTGRVYQTQSWLKDSNGEILAEADVTLVEPGKVLTSSIEPGDDQWVDWDQDEGCQ
jgi:acyl-coenzyme A thioesterase PaaI-like protein